PLPRREGSDMLGLLKLLTNRKRGLKNIESNNNKKNSKNNIIHYEWKKENVVFVVLLLFMPTLL
ncbi:hypothetical protein, partial [Prevotella sp.]|uniref:hypothetical protein n=1 Tax=Prevotella sp. TaxID=59823 RepID=UPI0025E85A6A